MRMYKHVKNMYSKNIHKYQKFKIRENMEKIDKRWRALNDLKPEEDSVPAEIVYKGKNNTSAKSIAEKFAEFQDDKLKEIRKSVEFENFKVVNNFKRIIPRVEDDVELEPITIREIKKIIRSMKSINSRGNTEITNRICKSLVDYLGVALAHLANKIYQNGVYPKIL